MSCGSSVVQKNIPVLEDWQVERICRLYVQRDFEELISEFYAYNDCTEDERRKAIMLFKQHVLQCDSVQNYPCDLEYLRAEVYPGDTIADIFVEKHYPDGRREEDMFTMIYVENAWFIR